jgi:hypothetical protein
MRGGGGGGGGGEWWWDVNRDGGRGLDEEC